MSNEKKPRDVIHLRDGDGKVASGKPVPRSQASASAQSAPTATSVRKPLFGK